MGHGDLAFVNILTSSASVISGVLYTTDPESKDVVLLRKGNAADYEVIIVLHTSIIAITPVEEQEGHPSWVKDIHSFIESSSHIPAPPPPLPEVISHDDGGELHAEEKEGDERRLKEVTALLKRAHVPYSIDNEERAIIIFDGVVRMSPPYDSSSISGHNEIMISRLMKLLG